METTMDNSATSLVIIIGACAMFCNIIALLGKNMHEDQRLATVGCFLLSLCLTVLGIFLEGTFPYFAYAGTVFILYTLGNLIAGEKMPFFISGVFFIAFMLYLGYTARYLTLIHPY